MTEPKLTYLGPIEGRPRTAETWLRRAHRNLPIPFLVIVALPTLIAAVYLLLIASPRYVSEAQFIVRSPNGQPTSIGMALQGVGLSGGQSDAFAVHEYLSSRDGLRELGTRYDVSEMLGRPNVDVFSRFPLPWENRSFESLYRGFQRFITVGYDSTTGISTLRVEAFRPSDAQTLAAAMLDNGERLVNRLNNRASSDAVAEAQRTVDEAEQRLSRAQTSLSNFRNQAQFIDPSRTAEVSGEVIGELMTALAAMKAERSQLAVDAPTSPQIPALDSRIRAYQSQIEQEQAKIAGNSDSLALKMSRYEALMLDVEFAGRALTAANAAQDVARLEARRKSLYLERIVSPSLPDEPTRPKRWFNLLAVFISCLMIYGVGWLIWAGVREHGNM